MEYEGTSKRRLKEDVDSERIRVVDPDKDGQEVNLTDGMVVDGYSNFLIRLLEKDLDIQLKTKVTGVSVTPRSKARGRRPCSVTVTRQSEEGRWGPEEVVDADYVIVTLPLGVLKKAMVDESIRFSPSLPREK
eukprot:1486249-Rhodomonas_salina.1